MKKQPLVTVYITNYNYGKFIRRSIESVLSQSMNDFELLIIDDGSTDDSKTIIEEYRDNDQVSIIYQQNKGLNVTNNIAMRSASGKYLMRLDADDYLHSDALRILSGALDVDDTLGLVFPDYYYVDAAGHIIGEERRHNFENEVSLYDLPAHGACTMIRLEYLRNLGGYNETFTCQDGYDLWIKFIMHHKVNNIGVPLFFYRRHGNNLTTNEERILNTRVKIKELYLETYKVTTPSTVAVIPVRNTFIKNTNWPLFSYNDTTILENAVDKAEKAERINWVVVTTAEEEVLEYLESKKRLYKKLIVIPRPKALARVNESLSKTYELVLEQLAEQNIHPGAIMSLSLEYPFITSDIINDAVNTLTIFKADSLLSVRPDNRMYYQHIGHGMVPLLDQEKFTKLEREALYKAAGGISISTSENFKTNKKLISGKVSHIIVSEQLNFGVFSAFDFTIFSKLVQENSIKTETTH